MKIKRSERGDSKSLPETELNHNILGGPDRLQHHSTVNLTGIANFCGVQFFVALNEVVIARIAAGQQSGIPEQVESGTLMTLECLGSCDTAPVALIGDTLHENLTIEKVDQILDEL